MRVLEYLSAVRRVLSLSCLPVILLHSGASRYGLAQSSVTISKTARGVRIETAVDVVNVEVCSDHVFHIVAGSRAELVDHPGPKPWIVAECKPREFSLSRQDNFSVLKSSAISLSISLKTGALSFQDAAGNGLLEELGERSYESLAAEPGLYKVTERFRPIEDEAIYGLGQHQSGMFDYRGSLVHLAQANTDVAIPFFLSTRGYGVLWNTAAASDFDNRIPHTLYVTASTTTTIDYYFIAGPEPDQIIHAYRDLTGHVPMFGKWVFGLSQSKDRYTSQDELLNVAAEYRRRRLPLDTVVQDWFWWTKQGSGDFNTNYPSPAAAFRTLHEEHLHAMISIWPTFDADAPIAREMANRHWLIEGTETYDATNPAARDLYWKVLPAPLLDKGVDALWMDATEPEQSATQHGIPPGLDVYLGRSSLFTNIYPFAHTEGVYRHWRERGDGKRPFILSRSAFLGSQRTAAATWSGDVYSTFWSLARQVPAGLNFSVSGLPYWTTDIGGYGYPDFKSSQDPQFRELFTRWFEYSTFLPLFRIHGHRSDNRNEMYSYGPETNTLESYDRLRYRLLPYIYSLAWKVTSGDYTMMRPLMMDWRSDRRVWEIGDQYMFGPALLVSPVTKSSANTRPVYLPHAAAWYNFWTGERLSEGLIQAAAPLEKIPVYVPAGSILPLGPTVEYATEGSADPIELRIYEGADGSFDLYSDEGDGYGYEHGAHTIIPLQWNDALHTITIGERQGSYLHMASKVVFHIVKVGPGHGTGGEITNGPDTQAVYSGHKIEIRL